MLEQLNRDPGVSGGGTGNGGCVKDSLLTAFQIDLTDQDGVKNRFKGKGKGRPEERLLLRLM